MSTIIGVDTAGNVVQFQADAHPIEADVATAAGIGGGVTVTSISNSGASTLTGNVAAGGTLAVTGATTLAAATSSGLITTASLKVDTSTKTATAAVGGAATLAKSSGIITSAALTTAAGANFTMTLTNSTVAAGDLALVSVDSNGSAGLPLLKSAKCTANTLTVIVNNAHATDAFDAAIKIGYLILKA